MKTPMHGFSKLMGVAATSLVLAACSAPQTQPEGAQNARAKLAALQSNPQLASRAPLEIKTAESAVIAAEEPRQDKELSNHLVFMADRTVDIAWARAQSRQLEDDRKLLGEQRASARLDARTREADRANIIARTAQEDAQLARNDADDARLETEELQRQITELNARETDRGLVVTLGDVLFATGRSELKGGAASNLGKLAGFLGKYQDRMVLIEGHTDNVGSDDSNMDLSRRRANSVLSYLVAQGVDSTRLTASGQGETTPIADNDSDMGRQQNRRVEVIISNAAVSMR